MTSFFAIERYSPLAVLVIGVSTFIGVWGVGTIAIRSLRLQALSPWSHLTAILFGIQAQSLVVQVLAMLGLASRPVLSFVWWVVVVAGAGVAVLRLRTTTMVQVTRPGWRVQLLLGIIVVALICNFFVALAPSTKIDELYYHMLVPSRIVTDGTLIFFREPWEAAIWPQMVFQIFGAPLHAMGYPDALNVVSWGLSATLLWFAWHIIRDSKKSASWAAFWVASLCVGIYSVRWHVTGGAHAMGDLAMAAAIVAFCDRERLLGALGQRRYAFLFSILLLSAATSKVVLLPLCAVLFCFIGWPLLRSSSSRMSGHVAFALFGPWIVLYCPIMLWTWMQSGSPFGPLLTSVFPSSVYSADRLNETLEFTRNVNQQLIPALQGIVVGYSPLVWFGAIGVLWGTRLTNMTRVVLSCLFAMQCGLIYWLLPHDVRFLGGVHYGALVAFAAFATRETQGRLGGRWPAVLASSMFLIPWLGIQMYYATQFFRVSLGLEKVPFYERHVAFYADYVKLDSLLPKDAVLLVRGFRLSSVYAPRPVYFDPADVPTGRNVFLFSPPEAGRAAGAAIGNYKIDDVIYENRDAVTVTYRTPGREDLVGPLQVAKLRN